MAEKHITERKAPEATAPGKGRAGCNSAAGELGEKAPSLSARGKARAALGSAVGSAFDVSALDWDGWLAEKALQRAAWRARGG